GAPTKELPMWTACFVWPGDRKAADKEIGGLCRIVVLLAAVIFVSASQCAAQTTLNWANPGSNPNIDDPANWGGTAPNFSTDPLVSDSALFSTSSNTSVKLRDTTTGDPFKTVTFDAPAPAYSFNLPSGNTTNELAILAGGNITNASTNTQNLG